MGEKFESFGWWKVGAFIGLVEAQVLINQWAKSIDKQKKKKTFFRLLTKRVRTHLIKCIRIHMHVYALFVSLFKIKLQKACSHSKCTFCKPFGNWALKKGF